MTKAQKRLIERYQSNDPTLKIKEKRKALNLQMQPPKSPKKWWDVYTKPSVKSGQKPRWIGSVRGDDEIEASGKARRQWWFQKEDYLLVQVKVPKMVLVATQGK